MSLFKSIESKMKGLLSDEQFLDRLAWVRRSVSDASATAASSPTRRLEAPELMSAPVSNAQAVVPVMPPPVRNPGQGNRNDRAGADASAANRSQGLSPQEFGMREAMAR